MPIWPYRYQLSVKDRLRRSVYEVLRDRLDGLLVQEALVESYRAFHRAGEPYPFVSMRELKPRAKIIEQEYPLQKHFLVIFCEGSIPRTYKKYIRFFDTNKITKESLGEFAHVKLSKNYTRNLRHFDNPDFGPFLIDLSTVDYALLIQQDPTIKRQNRYLLTHFHVRMDWPIDDATEDMALGLRYIGKELYERGEKYAQHLHNKLFEQYGFHHVVGGRRTAAVIAAQILQKLDSIATVYVASAEARALSRISERGTSKYVLLRLPLRQIDALVKEQRTTLDRFVERYLVDITDEYGVGILQVAYRRTPYSKPPEDGRLRKLRPDYQWLTVSDQLLIPMEGYPDARPLPYSIIYS